MCIRSSIYKLILQYSNHTTISQIIPVIAHHFIIDTSSLINIKYLISLY